MEDEEVVIDLQDDEGEEGELISDDGEVIEDLQQLANEELHEAGISFNSHFGPCKA